MKLVQLLHLNKFWEGPLAPDGTMDVCLLCPRCNLFVACDLTPDYDGKSFWLEPGRCPCIEKLMAPFLPHTGFAGHIPHEVVEKMDQIYLDYVLLNLKKRRVSP